MKKIKPNHTITVIAFIIIFLFLEFLLWSICGIRPWKLNDPTYRNAHKWFIDLIYTLCCLFVSLTGLIIYIVKTHYIVDDHTITRKGGKNNTYYFFNIAYVDEEYSKKKLEVKFYYTDGYWVYLRDNKNKELLNEIKNHCKLLTFDEFQGKYPKALESYEKK